MDYLKAFAISAAGMNVERTRVDVAALNLANANTVQTAGGSSYQPSRVVARATGPSGVTAFAPSFAEQLDLAAEGGGLAGLELPESWIERSPVPARMVHDPGHPYADARGFVAYPGVDTATEMVTLMTALRAYEANVAAMNSARTLALRALDIGGGA